MNGIDRRMRRCRGNRGGHGIVPSTADLKKAKIESCRSGKHFEQCGIVEIDGAATAGEKPEDCPVQAARATFWPWRIETASRSQSARPQRPGSSRATIRSGSGTWARSTSRIGTCARCEIE
jgi:hypothetical protein